MHGFRVISTVLFTLLTLFDFNAYAYSITRHHQESSSQYYAIFDLETTSKNSKPFCTSNSDCQSAYGESCVSGLCRCNLFGWIHDSQYLSSSSHSHRCYQYICKLHEECRTYFGQGAYCLASGFTTGDYCSCATEIDQVTQICANPYLQINTTCSSSSVCKEQYGPQAHCQYRTCVCKHKFRFSPRAQKCVPLDENVHVKDFPQMSPQMLLLLFFLICLCACCCAKMKKQSRNHNNVNGHDREQLAAHPGQVGQSPEQLRTSNANRNSRNNANRYQTELNYHIQPGQIAQYLEHLRHSNRNRNPTNPNPVISRQTPDTPPIHRAILNNRIPIIPTHFPVESNLRIQLNQAQQDNNSVVQPKPKPKPKPLDPPPNYVDALFDSTKVELVNLPPEQQKDDDDKDSCPPEYSSLLYSDSLDVKK